MLDYEIMGYQSIVPNKQVLANLNKISKSEWPGRLPGIAGNAGNHGNDGKFHKSHQILNQTKRNINKSCLGKNLRHKTVRIKFSVDSGFSNELYCKK